MPTYCFSDRDGNVIEKYFGMANVPESVNVGGTIFKRDFTAEHQGVKSKGDWPEIECIASGVNAAQAGELREHFRKNGMNIEVTNDGNPVYTSPSQRRKALKLRGFVDKSSYY